MPSSVLLCRKLVALCVFFAAATSFALAQASPSPSSSPTSAPSMKPVGPGYTVSKRPEDPETTKRAKQIYAQLVSGSIDRAKLDDELNAALTPQVISALSLQLTALGPVNWSFISQVDTAKGPVSIYKLSSPALSLILSFGIDKDGKISNLLLKPGQ